MGKRAGSAVDLHVGARIRARRMALGLSQGDLSCAMGISFQQVQKYEKGSNRIGPERLLAAAAALRVPVQYFFEDLLANDLLENHRSGEGGFAQEGLSEGQQAHLIVRSFNMIDDPELRQNIVEFVAAIAASRKLRAVTD